MKTDRISRSEVRHHVAGALQDPGAILQLRPSIFRSPAFLRVPPTARAHCAVALLVGMSAVPTYAATNIVTSLADAGPGSLRQVITESAPGDTIVFSVTGTITLGSGELVLAKDLTILGPGSSNLAVSGNDLSRIFRVNTNVSVAISSLTVRDGRSGGKPGGGIYNSGALSVRDCVISSNAAGTAWTGAGAKGGGVYNDGGTVAATNCAFTANMALGVNGTASFDPDGKPGRGGAIYSSGFVRASQCTFSDNSARGGNGVDAPDASGVRGFGGAGQGGAIYNLGQASVTTCTFHHNYVRGGAGGMSALVGISFIGGSGGEASGGAVFSPGTLNMSSSLISENAATGGAGGNGRDSPNQGWGLGLYNEGGIGGNGGTALGALYAGSPSSLINCTLAGNQAQGGAGGTGGNGGFYLDMGSGYYIYGSGGTGGCGGDAPAAVYDPAGILRLTNCTVTSHIGRSGGGGMDGRNGDLSGGGSPSPAGIPRGALLVTNAVMVNTIVAANLPTNCSGTIVDAGHNLSSDGSCGFTNVGSLNHTDPRLAPLADNGGPTLTIALLPGSPAVDAGDTAAAPATDQRGLPRPYGLAADIGAYEYWLTVKVISCPTGGVDIVAFGIEGQSCCLLVSTNLVNWAAAATNSIGADWTTLFHDDPEGQPQWFYRAMLH